MFLPDGRCLRFTMHKSRIFIRLRALLLSSRSFSHALPLFSIVCGLFLQNTRVGGTSKVGGLPMEAGGCSKITAGLRPAPNHPIELA